MAVKRKVSKVAKRMVPRRLLEKAAAEKDVAVVPHVKLTSGLKKKILIGVLLVFLVALSIYKKHWFVAAFVNNKPITTLELVIKLYGSYKAQALEGIVSERIVLDEARKRGVLPTVAEVDAKYGELVDRFGGEVAFAGLLEQQGQKRATVRDQIKVQLAMEKMYSSEVSVSDGELKQFVDDNKQFLQASDSATQKVEAEKVLRQRKLSEIFSGKFEELKGKANVKIF